MRWKGIKTKPTLIEGRGRGKGKYELRPEKQSQAIGHLASHVRNVNFDLKGMGSHRKIFSMVVT